MRNFGDILFNNKKRLFPLVLLTVILIFVIYGVRDASSNSEQLQYDMTMRAISRALADCYAIEGHYPPNIQYLFDNYRISVDEEKYLVIYDIFAPNISPTVRLIDRKQLNYG